PKGNGIYTVKATVYNAMGQQVRTLINRKMESGFHRISWEGVNDAGERMPEGMYFYRLSVSHENGRKYLTGKIIFGN
ncbi:MAG: gliding motility-associated C-terminal domain-containing protein, partial [Bacteroidetes bacterium]|nr:gliding motility-associated C-terminal domain-containing protein [Bacteroidota bacterium]